MSKGKKTLALTWLVNLIILTLVGGLYFLLSRGITALGQVQIETYLLTKRKEDFRSLAGLLADTSPLRGRVNTSFVSESAIADFIERLESIARTARVELSLTDVETGDNSLILNFGARGEFTAMYQLLSLLETLPFKVSLPSVNLRLLSGAEVAKPLWQGEFNLVLLSFTKAGAAVK